MFEVKDKPEMVERALLVRLTFVKREVDEDISLLDELEELVHTLGIGVADKMLAHSRAMHRKYLCGTGKAAEVVEFARAHECDCIVLDNELAPSQQREWEELAGMCVIDREEVILDIFAQRAQTKEATLQVELARMQYALPRMARMWGHLDREGGGGTGGRGMGEQQIEVDRRLARKKIDSIKKELEAVRTQRATRRKDREKLDMAHGAIVGYTNAGKSTLLNRLSGSDIMAKDMLFATLDTTTRSIEIPDGQTLLLTDTVGFVRNLPHRLVEAFKAGDIDFRAENSSKRWATAYKMEEVDNGEIILDTPPDKTPGAIQAYFFNLRRAPFDDQRVRQAINLLYDFETIKRTILYNQYARINSYFPNSDYGVTGAPTAEELKILEPFKDQLSAQVLTDAFVSPVSDGSGRNRKQLREALGLFNAAGWELEGGRFVWR